MNQFQSFQEVFSALRRRAHVIFVITFVGCMFSIFFALSQPKEYEATAVVQIENASVPDQLVGATAQAEDSAHRVRLIEQRLMSRDNLVRIMEEHDLFNDDPSIAMNERIFRMRNSVRIEQIVNQAQPYAPGANVPSGLIIVVRLGDAKKAADLANELMYTVIEQSRDRSLGRARDTLDFFAIEEERVGAEIDALEAQISIFKRKNSEALPAGVTDLREQLALLREAELDLDKQILTLETTSDRQRGDVKDRQIALLQEQKLLLIERTALAQRKLSEAPEVERNLNALKRQLLHLQDQYSVITRRKAEAELGQMLEDRQQTDRFEVLETALEPEYSVSRSRKRTAMIGGVVSGLLGLLVGFVIELMNPAIRTPGQMERALGIRPVVSIPYVTVRTGTPGGRKLKWAAGLIAAAAAVWGGMSLILSRIPGGDAVWKRVNQRIAQS